MIVRVDTDLLRRILAASRPAGACASELYVESRVSLHVAVDDEADDPGHAIVERRWETGAHLRRFSEGRHESFVLDAPTPESLEALALHPEAVAVEWLSGEARLGVARDHDTATLEATLADASPSAPGGPWSSAALQAARDLAGGWRDRLRAHAAGLGASVTASASLASHVQEVVVLATDRDPARDTRSFTDLMLHASLERDGRTASAAQTLSASTIGALAALAGRENTSEDLVARTLRGLESAAAPRGEMPVVFASPSGGFLLHEICGHLLEADHILRGASPFTGARGQAVASPLLTLADDGSIAGMRGSTLFDDEGVAARRTPLIMEGTLVGYLSDRLTAFATHGISTGNGRRQSYRDAPMPRMTNLVIDPGGPSFDEIVASTSAGLLVTRLGRGRVDPSTGRFALAVEEGFVIEQGRAGAPVAGVVLRGAARELLQCIDAVGCDPVADTGAPMCVKEDQAIPFGIRQPTLRVARVSVTGAEP